MWASAACMRGWRCGSTAPVSRVVAYVDRLVHGEAELPPRA